ncbi:UNVERIFIED_ORG: hypothetical protein GGD51_004254 [Rhizobium esperanzae]
MDAVELDRGPAQPIGDGRKRRCERNRQVADPDADADGDSDKAEGSQKQCGECSQLPEETARLGHFSRPRAFSCSATCSAP